MAFRNSELSKGLVSQAKAFVSKSGDRERERARESQIKPVRFRESHRESERVREGQRESQRVTEIVRENLCDSLWLSLWRSL